MQKTEPTFKDMLFCMLRKWRLIAIVFVIFAVLGGTFSLITNVIAMNDEENIEQWQTEYEIAQGVYWAAIYDLDHQISENERLATKLENELATWESKKTTYELQIADIEGRIDHYNGLVENYKKSNEQLQAEREKLNYHLTYQTEQNENSLLMAIDPYNVNAYEVYLRIDTGYEILPGNTYQNIDRTAEILQTYRLLVTKTNFYEKMISDLNLDTEVRYLTDVITAVQYNTNSIRIRVISDSSTWAKAMAEYVADTLLAAHDHVEASIAKHELSKYNTIAFSAVDFEIYSQQQNAIQKALGYEKSIRDMNATILNNEAAIREINTEIRACGSQIGELNRTINDLPLERQTKENEVSAYRNANYTLRQEQLDLLATPEPAYKGYTTADVISDFVQYALISGIVSAVVVAICVVLLHLGDKVLSAEQLCETLQSEFFGYWPETRKTRFAFVDRWVSRVSCDVSADMTAEDMKSIVFSNASIACHGVKKILLCGDAEKEIIAETGDAIMAQFPDIELIRGGTLSKDPTVIRGILECDAVVLVEKVDKSSISTAIQLKSRAEALNKPVLGVVLHGAARI